ncbi:MAG: hypothetical protein F9K29_18530 [Hyphomicrobiaceae bacterium]|nr:MAG: hypothetical protein F9K29_18530 [Hyphomicrobiaceae bacterium]
MARLMLPSSAQARRWMPRLSAGVLMLLAALVLRPAAVSANWLTKIVGTAEHVGARTARHGAGALDNVAQHVKALPPKSGAAVLAAHATQVGHWRFVNRAGETFTAGTPDELKRVASVLLPEAGADVKLTLYLTEDTIFAQRALLKDLPKGTDLHVLVRGESYRILRSGEGVAERLFAEIRPNLLVEVAERRLFEEAVWQLARPLNKANVRVLALEPGGPPTLSSAPRLDPATKRALVDTIDPASLPAALGSVRGQTVVVTGRVDGQLLYVKPSSGPERSLLIKDLFAAAEATDVNLVVLQSASTPRQPGGRNWLWQKVQVKGLDEALQRARVADFLNALGGPSGRLAVTATPGGAMRTVLDVRPVAGLPGGPVTRPIGDVFSEIMSDVTGKVITASVQANVRSAERQQELDQRIIPGVPAALQTSYLVFLVFGLFGLPVSRAWWQRIWPREAAQDYAGRTGYWAARLVRGASFLFVFMPLTAPVSAPLQMLKAMWDAVTAPLRWWRWLFGRSASAGA